MNCLNCDTPLQPAHHYCSDCGAKVIHNRLTVGGILSEALSHFTNLDNSLYRTLGDLTIRPERVCMGFIQGLRKRYLNPGSYLAFNLTLSGILIYFLLRAKDKINMDVWGQGTSPASTKIFEAISDFQAILYIAYIPLAAIASFWAFPRQRLNFGERSVIFTYALSHFTVLTFVPSLYLILTQPEHYMSFSMIALLLMFAIFGFYVVRCAGVPVWKIFPRLIVFYFLLFVLYIGMSIAMNIFFLLTGYLTLQDLVPAGAQ